jgi:hypothetical protein
MIAKNECYGLLVTASPASTRRVIAPLHVAAVERKCSKTAFGDIDENRLRTNAEIPATTGAAIDVPRQTP